MMTKKGFVAGAMLMVAMTAAACGGSAASAGSPAGGNTTAQATSQEPAASAGQSNGGGAAAGTQGSQNGSGRFNSANFTAGQVKQVSGNTLTLTAANGVDVTVNVAGQAQVEKMAAGSLSDIQAGQRISAQGTKQSDGSFSAQMIRLVPAGNGPQGGAQNAARPRRTPSAGQTGGNQNGSGQFNPDNFAAGQVKQVNGNALVLTTANGDVTVNVDGKTQIEKMVQGSLSDVKTGDQISAQGTRNSDGTFTAQTIQIGGGFGGNRPQPATAPSSGG
jgi:hypothetical protein